MTKRITQRRSNGRVCGRDEIAEYLRENAELDFGDAVSFGVIKRVKELLQQDSTQANQQYGPGYLPLNETTISGCEDMVVLLLTHGADPLLQDGEGYTAFDLAQEFGQEKILQILSKHIQ